jgi:hypothetical protein
MNKINLVLRPNEFTSFSIEYLRPLFTSYFNISRFDPSANYTNDTLFVAGLFGDMSWGEKLINSGHKFVVDNLWEQENLKDIPKASYVLLNKDWFWYNESLWYESLGYKEYNPSRNYSKLAFMPMNLVRPHRDLLVNALGQRIDTFIHSYNSSLPGDNKSVANWQRYFNPDWYNSTYFSLVAETIVELADKDSMFITEKTYKPMAFKHPFLIYGPPNLLKALKDNGFVTYENLFNESYDSLTDVNDKVFAMLENVDNFKQTPYDQITLEKIEHNYNHFYNKSLVLNRIKKEIIEPLIEYAETR